jgi:hypothetical protein
MGESQSLLQEIYRDVDVFDYRDALTYLNPKLQRTLQVISRKISAGTSTLSVRVHLGRQANLALVDRRQLMVKNTGRAQELTTQFRQLAEREFYSDPKIHQNPNGGSPNDQRAHRNRN